MRNNKTIENQVEEQWREFYLPYTFGEILLNTYDNPMEEEQFIKQNEYTTEEN